MLGHCHRCAASSIACPVPPGRVLQEQELVLLPRAPFQLVMEVVLDGVHSSKRAGAGPLCRLSNATPTHAILTQRLGVCAV